jgi:tetratricopeptide (TPR) repeat protein
LLREKLEAWLCAAGFTLSQNVPRTQPMTTAVADSGAFDELVNILGGADAFVTRDEVILFASEDGPRKQLYVLCHETLHHWAKHRFVERDADRNNTWQTVFATERETNMLCALSAERWHLGVPSNALGDLVGVIVTLGAVRAAARSVPFSSGYSHADFSDWAKEVCDWYDSNRESLLDRANAFCSEIEAMVPTRDDPQARVAAAERAVDRDPANPYVLSGLGIALLNANRPAEAVGPLRQALALEPTPGGRKLLGFALSRASAADEAVAIIQAALRDTGEDRLLRKELASSLFELGRYAEANESYQVALDHEPHLVWERLRLGLCQLMEGELEAGWRSMRQAREQAPGDATIAHIFGMAEKAFPT